MAPRSLARIAGRLLVAAAVLTLVALAAAWWAPLPRRLAVTDSTVVRWRDGQAMHVFLAPDERWRIGVEVEDVDPAYVAALKRFEDRRFDSHPGVDPLAIARAASQNLAHGRVVSGASTLTMQLARLLEPRPRTVRSKAIEALVALQLELRLSKRRILAEYLRFAPYGRNVEGVAAASLAYFGHGPGALAPEEIATLLAVPQAPGSRRPSVANAGRLRRSRDAIAGRLWDAGVADEVRRSPVVRRLLPFARDAPHAAGRLRAEHPGVAEIRTTLDQGEQRLVERVLAEARPGLVRRGIHNGVVVVADPGAAEVIAIVGNLAWDDDAHGGQIAGFDVARSAGSLLKPFLFASALDSGLALPGHSVVDIPAPIGGWVPRNYDGEYEGLVRLDEALARSRNVPFVRLLQRVEVEPFLGRLGQLGARRFDRRPGWYGLSAAIGGVEITPLEAATMYAALARDGQARPLRLVSDSEPSPGSSVFTPGAAWLTRQALARGGLHWKSGTSYGHRDAWAVGSQGDRTVAVWLGNFDNRSSSALVGGEAAGPLLFDLLAVTHGRSTDDPPPPDLVAVRVCGLSGHVLGPACPDEQARTELAPQRSVAAAACPLHEHVDVERASGLAIGPGCRAGLPPEAWQTLSVVRLPSAVRSTLEQAGSPLLATAAQAPEWAPGCAPGQTPAAPSILSPPGGLQVRLIPGLAADAQEVPFIAEAAAGGELSWFVNGEYLGVRRAGERLWWIPRPGDHEVRVIDSGGRSASRRIRVLGADNGA